MHVVQSLDVGGLENGVVNLLNQLSDDRWRHAICCLTHAGKLVERLQATDISIIEVGLNSDRFRFPLFTLRKIFRTWAPDILHTRGWGTIDGIFAARAAGVPRVIHGEHGREAADPEGQNRKRNVIRRCLSPLVDRFVSVSDDLKDWLIHNVGIPERKVVRIHNGVDLGQFSTQGREAARRLLALDESAFVIGTVGRLDPVKDHTSLLQAFAPLTRLNSPVRLIIAGEGPARKQIESQIRELKIGDNVQLLGERRDVAQVLKACDVYTLTSIAEGMSNTILEAMASALPVVATRVGGNPELVEDGVSGQLVGASDVEALTAAFQRYLLDPMVRIDHGNNGRARAVQHFSLEHMAAEYAELYRSVIEPRAEGRGQRAKSG